VRGLRLDTGNVNWEEVAAFVTDSYLTTARNRIAALVEQ
jgi:hypothetical protein